MKNRFFKKTRNILMIGFLQGLRFLFFFVPLRACRAAGVIFGRAAYYIFPKERAKAYKNIDIAFGETMPAPEKKSLVRRNFENYGTALFEFVKFTVRKPEKTASLVKETDGIIHFEKAAREKKGLIAVTAHYSNWEVLPVYFACRGFKIGVIGRKLFDDRLDKIVNTARRAAGVRAFDRDRGTREMIRALKKPMVLGILADQDTRVDSEFIDFLGKPAKTPVGPAVIAKKMGLYICTVFIERRKDGFYKITINKPYNIENMSHTQIAEMYNRDISERIKKDPAQWAWIHERWKTIEN